MADVGMRLAAIAIVELMKEWPGLSWEDVVAINRTMGFSPSMSTNSSMEVPGVGRGGGRLSKTDLWEAWELAGQVASTQPR